MVTEEIKNSSCVIDTKENVIIHISEHKNVCDSVAKMHNDDQIYDGDRYLSVKGIDKGIELIKKAQIDKMLNLNCAETNKMIRAGEVVKLFNWGTQRLVIGYGKYDWDENERAFTLIMNETLNNYFGLDNSGIDDRYDLFRTSPEKLTKEELAILN